MKKQIVGTILAIIAATGVAAAQSFTIEWSTAGLSGVTADPLEGMAIGEGASFITPISFTRGPDLNAASNSNGWSSNGWNSTTGGAYLEFGFSIAEGYQVDLSNFLLGTSTSNTGPRDMAIIRGMETIASFQNSDDSFVNSDLDFSALQALTGDVTFRIVATSNLQADGIGDIGSTGAFRIVQFFDSETSMLTASALNGTVSAVPEPSIVALFALSLITVVVFLRRRHTNA